MAVRGGLGDVPGAVGGTRVEGRRSDDPQRDRRALEEALNNPMGYKTPEGVDDTLRYAGPDGKPRIVSRNPRELIYHLRLSLAQRDRHILRQTLSEETRRRYRDRGLNPDEAVEFMLTNADEFIRLLALFPMGELTPGQHPYTVGRNTFRLEVPRYAADPPLRFTRLDYVYESDGCRLVLMH